MILRRSNAADNPQSTVEYLKAAAQVPGAGSTEKLFQMVLDGDVRSQDSFWVLALMLGHRENGPLTWDLIRENWDAVIAAVPPQSGSYVFNHMHYLSEPDVAASIEEWFEDHSVRGGEKHIRQRLELLRVRVGLRERERETLVESLG